MFGLHKEKFELLAENTVLKGVWLIFMIEKSHIAKCLDPLCCLRWKKMRNAKPCLTQEYTMTPASSKGSWRSVWKLMSPNGSLFGFFTHLHLLEGRQWVKLAWKEEIDILGNRPQITLNCYICKGRPKFILKNQTQRKHGVWSHFCFSVKSRCLWIFVKQLN